MPEITYRFDENKKQAQALRLLLNENDIDILYGGAKGGGKSYLFCVAAFLYAHKIIELFKLNETDLSNPIIIGFLGRKRGSDFRHTTLETWKKVIYPDTYRIKEQSNEIWIYGKNNQPKLSYWFGGLDDQKNINKFNSAELAYIGVDQAEECEREEISVLEASRRLTYNGIKPPYKTFYSANPAECWLKSEFVQGDREKILKEQYKAKIEVGDKKAIRVHAYYIPALPTDNNYLPDGYIQQLEKSFANDLELLQAYRDGNWDVMTSTKRIITITMIENVKGLKIKWPSMKRLISVDPALGGDEVVIYYFENYEKKDEIICHHNNAVQIKQEITSMAHKHIYLEKRCNNIAIDTSCKIGATLADFLEDEKYNIIRCNSSEKASVKFVNRHFFNNRAYMWWKVRELFVQREILYPEDEKLRNQLTAVKFLDSYFGNGIVKLEPKNITKQNIGQSPDRADSFVYGMSSMDKILPESVDPKDYESLRNIEKDNLEEAYEESDSYNIAI